MSEKNTLRFNTKVDTDGAVKDINTLKKRLANCMKTLSASGNDVTAAYNGASSSVIDLNGKIRISEMLIEELRADIQRLENGQADAQVMTSFNQELEKAETKLEELLMKRGQLENAITPQGMENIASEEQLNWMYRQNTEWRKITAEIEKAENAVLEYRAKLESAALGGMTEKQIEEHRKKTMQLEREINQLDVYKAKLREKQAAENAASASTKKMGSAAGKTTKKIGGLSRCLKMLTQSLKMMVIFRVLTALIDGAKEGLNNLAQYSDETNKSLSQLKSSTTKLKNSVASALAPALNAIAPILAKVINSISSGVTYLGMFIAALTGAKTFVKAVSVQEDYAKSLDGTSKAAKNAQKQLAGFDELNVLGSNETSGTDHSEMFETVNIDDEVMNMDFSSFGKKIAEAINNIDWVGIAKRAGGILNDTFLTVLDMVIGFAEELDWGKLGKDIWNGFLGIVTSIDWSQLISKAYELLGAAIGGSSALIAELCIAIWESIKIGFENIKEKYFSKYMNELGGFTISGFFQGILDMLKDIGSWIVNNIFTPFINGFKNAFGIHSPSTVMAEMGRFLIQGLLNGITEAWNGITTFFSTMLSNLTSWIQTSWTNLKTNAATIWKNISDTIANTWSNIRTATSDAVTNTFSTVSSTYSKVKESVVNNLNAAKTSAGNLWTNIKTAASNANTTLKTNVSSAWTEIKTTMVTKLSEVKTTMGTVFTGLKNSATTWGKDICANLAGGIRGAMSTVTSAVTSVANKIKSFLGFSEPEDGPLSNFHTYMPDMLELMAEGIYDNQHLALNAVSEVAEGISKELNDGEYSVGQIDVMSNLTSVLDEFTQSITDKFAVLMDKIQSVADGASFIMPAMATGSIIPQAASKTIAVNQFALGNNMETPDAGGNTLDMAAMMAGFEAVVQAIKDKDTNVVIGDEQIGKANGRYAAKMAVITGGG